MPCYVGLDVSKRYTSVCVLDAAGNLVREGRVETSPEALIGFLRGANTRYARVGLEACGMSSWLASGLARARLPVVCIDARHAHGVLKARANKTDRSDALGIADLMRTSTYKAVHVKSRQSQEILALLTARRALQRKIGDLDNLVRALLLESGHKAPRMTTDSNRSSQVRQLLVRSPFLASVVDPLLDLRAVMLNHLAAYEQRALAAAAADPVCQLLVTAPGIGRLTALTYRAVIDDPHRFVDSRSIGPHLGLVPRTYQSGESERRGRISKHGSRDLRSLLYLAGLGTLRANTRASWLKSWGQAIAQRRGRKRAAIAVARRLAVTLHRMWMSGEPFRWELKA